MMVRKRTLEINGLQTLPQALYNRGIAHGHVLFSLTKRIWLDGKNITPLGVIWCSLLDDLVLVLRREEGDPIDSLNGVARTFELCGYLQLEIGVGSFSPMQIDRVIAQYPVFAGHLRPVRDGA